MNFGDSRETESSTIVITGVKGKLARRIHSQTKWKIKYKVQGAMCTFSVQRA